MDRSLVLVDEVAEGLRYRLLETVREYAREKLAAPDERTAIRNRHRDWYLQLAEQSEPGPSGSTGSGRDRVLRAWRRSWTTSGRRWRGVRKRPMLTLAATRAPPPAGLRLADALFWFWTNRGYLTEGWQWLGGALARTADLPSGLRVHALWAASQLASAGGRRELSRSFLLSARADQEKTLI